MSTNLLSVLIFAASADKVIAKKENELIATYRELYPALRELSDDDVLRVTHEVRGVIASKKEDEQISKIGAVMSIEEKNTAYALALEVCASDFSMVVPQETNFLKNLLDVWQIEKKVDAALKESIRLRYGLNLE